VNKIVALTCAEPPGQATHWASRAMAKIMGISLRTVVCFDESPIQLIGEIRVPITPKPGKRYRYDSEYKRNGTANLFVMVDVTRASRSAGLIVHRAGNFSKALARARVRARTGILARCAGPL
jgi:hypothetical protein